MNTKDKMRIVIDQLKTRAAGDKVTERLIRQLDKLDQEMNGPISAFEHEPNLKLPYSSMPKLTSKCWR